MIGEGFLLHIACSHKREQASERAGLDMITNPYLVRASLECEGG